MADFLTRLASRTLGLAPVAEPVIAPMFAPDPSLPSMAGSDEDFDALQAPEPMLTPGALRPASSPESMVRPIAPRPRPDPAEARPAPPSAGEPVARAAAAAQDAAIVRDISPQRPPERITAANMAVDEDLLLMPSVAALRRPSLVGTPKPADTPLPAQAASPKPARTPSMWPEEPVAASDRSDVRRGRVAPSSWDVDPDELLLPLSPAQALPAKPGTRDRGRYAGR